MPRFGSEPVNANCVRDVAGAEPLRRRTGIGAHRYGRRTAMGAPPWRPDGRTMSLARRVPVAECSAARMGPGHEDHCIRDAAPGSYQPLMVKPPRDSFLCMR
jgi:hypothetical protein